MGRTVWISVAMAVCVASCTHPSPPTHLSSVAPPPIAGSLAIAIVYSGWEVSIGNEDLLPEDDPSRFHGSLHELAAAVDAAGFSKHGASDLGMLVVYDDKAVIRAPMGPLRRLTGASLGTQKDYFNVKGLELTRGVELALHELENVAVSRRVMIVVGDGADTNPAQATTKLRALAADARSHGVQVYAVVLPTPLSLPDQPVVESLTENTRAVREAGDLGRALERVFVLCCAP